MPSGFLWAGREVANFNLILELADSDGRKEGQQTQAIAGYNTLLAVANVLGPLAGGLVVQSLGYRWTFALSGFGRMAAAVMFLMLLKPLDLRRLIRRTPATE
jgi:MFS family permease